MNKIVPDLSKHYVDGTGPAGERNPNSLRCSSSAELEASGATLGEEVDPTACEAVDVTVVADLKGAGVDATACEVVDVVSVAGWEPVVV